LAFLVAALLLSLERICYVWVWRAPESFRELCHGSLDGAFGEPVDALRRIFYIFKGVQALVFLGWCYCYGDGSLLPLSGNLLVATAGVSLIAIGQVFNFGVFYQLGSVGVFYGNRFGYDVAWNTAFPLSVLRHPQYVGAVLSIWGFFIAMRFPRPDWYLLPCLETIYYFLGAHFERDLVSKNERREVNRAAR
jgi:phosphatidyl-N-methylethanolamine N-methyltransferase